VNRQGLVLALVATFLIGASLGLMSGILFTYYQHRGPGFMHGGPPPGGPLEGPGRHGMGPGAMLPRLREALDLTDEQIALIEPILKEGHANMNATRDSLRARIDRVLSPEQRERWRRLEARRGFPGETRGPLGRTHRALPGPEGEQR
jgi:hypothetical protein